MTTPKKTDPLTVEEVAAAAKHFFSLFNEVRAHAPKGTSIEDTIKLSESIFSYAHTRRAKEIEQDNTAAFGFNKDKEWVEQQLLTH